MLVLISDDLEVGIKPAFRSRIILKYADPARGYSFDGAPDAALAPTLIISSPTFSKRSKVNVRNEK
jgi:hypothetical protein